MTKEKRRRTIGQPTRRVQISVDALTDAVVQTVMQTNGVTYSAAICGMATHSALGDEGMKTALLAMMDKHLIDGMAMKEAVREVLGNAAQGNDLGA